METNDGMKEVYFNQYCSKCKHVAVEEGEDPCHDCLNEPVNQYSHKPVMFEENTLKTTKVENKEEEEN